MAANAIPGIAVGLIQDNALVYENGFGVRNLDTGEPMTSRSVMSMASVSKAFTATAIMQLIEAGKVNVDDTFVTHVPYFEMEDPRYKDITVRHLLAHNSGMPELTDDCSSLSGTTPGRMKALPNAMCAASRRASR